jgi:hypothetical protein
MPPKKQPLTREGEPKQTTKGGLEIPVPKRDEFFRGLERGASRKKSREGKPSESERGKR